MRMRISVFKVLAAIFVIGITEAYKTASTAGTDLLAAEALAKLIEYQIKHPSDSSCTVETAHIRREWGSLSKHQRKDYTDAVLCLMSKPPLSDPKLVPGAKSRYDDFVAVHMNQSLFIHSTANFLSWHRYYVWAYETALRNECGYTGYQPYWNWGKYAFDPVNSPVFDGSDYSMSGNGVYAPHNCTDGLPSHLNCIPPGKGGGCVETGPFKNITVNLGPLAPTLTIPGLTSLGFDPITFAPNFAHNPRCLRRDISVWVSSNWTRDIDSFALLTQKTDILSFQNEMQGDFTSGFYGVHAGGHFTIGGDPGGDFFVSPADPAFWLHHAMIDRTWWIWQNLDLEGGRGEAIGGTITLGNVPPSRNGTLDDEIGLGVNGEDRKIREVMSTLGGPLCYIYL